MNLTLISYEFHFNLRVKKRRWEVKNKNLLFVFHLIGVSFHFVLVLGACSGETKEGGSGASLPSLSREGSSSPNFSKLLPHTSRLRQMETLPACRNPDSDRRSPESLLVSGAVGWFYYSSNWWNDPAFLLSFFSVSSVVFFKLESLHELLQIGKHKKNPFKVLCSGFDSVGKFLSLIFRLFIDLSCFLS